MSEAGDRSQASDARGGFQFFSQLLVLQGDALDLAGGEREGLGGLAVATLEFGISGDESVI
ncbi:hypothetical protein CQW39_30465 [Streptomyces griseofuscus]|uniref:Uncharacterized protein n=1 Tax=Streptomyces griseofuscus TaxID=146922 RepID=A0A426RX26_9ACTN|nr:hypothetical protein CQW39_30465 [Streptomyces griseofuscus]RRQ79167.1 hypothetical protein CQW44_34930 [Streptomyces griseofuscus]